LIGAARRTRLCRAADTILRIRASSRRRTLAFVLLYVAGAWRINFKSFPCYRNVTSRGRFSAVRGLRSRPAQTQFKQSKVDAKPAVSLDFHGSRGSNGSSAKGLS
jgi:hypothetical protein